jgi:ligand-binding sensor domain-containing protein
LKLLHRAVLELHPAGGRRRGAPSARNGEGPGKLVSDFSGKFTEIRSEDGWGCRRTGPADVVRLTTFVLILCSFLVISCSQGRQETQDASNLKSKTPAVTQSGSERTALPSYRLNRSFNTGEDSYVRSLRAQGGDLWVGTSEGVIKVARRTGELVRTYTMKDGLKSPYVFTIQIDPAGVKWFGTNNGGLSRFDGKHWRTYLPSDGLADFWVYAMDWAKDGTMWIGTWNGVNRFDGKKFVTYNTKDGLANRWCYALAVDRDGSVWFGTEGGVSRFDGKTWRTWRHKDGLGAPNELGLPKSDNTGFGTMERSLRESPGRDGKGYEGHRHDLTILDPQGRETYNEDYVFSMVIDREDNKWFGTWGGGASRFDGRTWKNFAVKDGLAGNVVYAITTDRDGNLWFGTNHGVSRFDGKSWETLRRADGLVSDDIYAVVVDEDNHVWLGEKGGVDELAKQ